MGKIGAIIPAAGKGLRMNNYFPKQFLPLKGHPVLYYALKVIEEEEMVDEIILVIEKEFQEYVEESIIKENGFRKIKKIIQGGKTRQESVYNGLLEAKGWEWVIIHDGARPFLTESLLKRVINEMFEKKAVIVGIPLHDTLKKVNKDAILNTLSRENLWTIQTPQAFSYSLIFEAYKKAKEEKFHGTDDASLVEKLGKKVHILMGNPLNIKITTPLDLILAQAIIEIGKT